MSKRTIDRWTWDYWLTQSFVSICYRVFYKKICFKGLENIPRNEPVILAPNHQNALMDALALVCNTPFQTVFIARADIFKGKFIIHLLTFFNIIPIYRIRDGIENVRRNDEVFDRTLQVFRNKFNPICIFPEGNHGDKRRLRPMVKGIFRMAFQAQEDYKESKGVKIIPIGIDYSNYTNFRSTVFINVGKPIEVSEFYPAYIEDKARAINELKDKLAEAVRPLMIDIRSEEFYDLYMNLRSIFNPVMREIMGIKGKSLHDTFVADKKMIEILDIQLKENKSALETLNGLVNEYYTGLKDMNLRDWVIRKNKFSSLFEYLKLVLLFLSLPIVLVGLVNNLIPYKLPERFVKNIKDPQFHSSFKFVLGMVLFPIYYLIMIILASVLIPGAIFSWLYIIFIPVSGFYAYKFFIGLKKIKSKLKFIAGKNKVESKTGKLIKLREEIVSITGHIIKKNYIQGTTNQ